MAFALGIKVLPQRHKEVKDLLTDFLQTHTEDDKNTCVYSGILYICTKSLYHHNKYLSDVANMLIEILDPKRCLEANSYDGFLSFSLEDLSQSLQTFEFSSVQELLNNFNTQKIRQDTASVHKFLLPLATNENERPEGPEVDFKPYLELYTTFPPEPTSLELTKMRKAVEEYVDLKKKKPDCSIYKKFIKLLNNKEGKRVRAKFFSLDTFYYCSEALQLYVENKVIILNHEGNLENYEINPKDEKIARQQSLLLHLDLIIEYVWKMQHLIPKQFRQLQKIRKNLNTDISQIGQVIPAYFDVELKIYFGKRSEMLHSFDVLKYEFEKNHLKSMIKKNQEEISDFFKAVDVIHIVQLGLSSLINAVRNQVMDLEMLRFGNDFGWNTAKFMVHFLYKHNGLFLFDEKFWYSDPTRLLDATIWCERLLSKLMLPPVDLFDHKLQLFEQKKEKDYMENSKYTLISQSFLKIMQFQYYLCFQSYKNTQQKTLIHEHRKKLDEFLQDRRNVKFAQKFEQRWKNKYKYPFFKKLLLKHIFCSRERELLSFLKHFEIMTEDRNFWDKFKSTLEKVENQQDSRDKHSDECEWEGIEPFDPNKDQNSFSEFDLSSVDEDPSIEQRNQQIISDFDLDLFDDNIQVN